MIFLIEYHRRDGRIVETQTFQDWQRTEAENTRLEVELKLNRRGVDHEVVLLQAESEGDLRRTHRRYFEDLSQLMVSQRAKDITIEFEPTSPCFYLNPVGVDATGQPLQVYRLRVKIRNNSPAFTARNTYVILKELLHEKDGQYIPEPRFEPLPLVWDWYSRDINPKDEVYAPFGEIGNPAYQAAFAANLSGGTSQPHFRFTVLAWPTRMTSHVDPGKHRFTLAANFDGEPPRAQQFELEWSGRWADDEDSMLKEIKVKTID